MLYFFSMCALAGVRTRDPRDRGSQRSSITGIGPERTLVWVIFGSCSDTLC